MVFIVVPPPKKCRLTKSRIKTLLIAFFYSKGLIHHEFVPAGTTVNTESYEGVLKRLLPVADWPGCQLARWQVGPLKQKTMWAPRKCGKEKKNTFSIVSFSKANK
ncbi:hypothetical protein AVEN_177229-1 [Araneus ventricosus]|uniref:Uncharacterized protein n=1 Tax=Araneus ventricosus TaxID=182803 RepID=A0A4Y2KVV4_ARAVE|nr:hypothetical protein AVEN_177229-1 [Araneus ventricosus]